MEELESKAEGLSPEPSVETAPRAESDAPVTEESPAAEPAADAPESAPEAETAVEAIPEPAADATEPASAPEPEAAVEAIPEPADASEAHGEQGAPSESISADELLAGTVAAPTDAASEDTHLRAVLEAIVYVTEEPLNLAQIAAALQQPAERVQSLLDQLVAEFDKPHHGVTIREVAGGFKMATKAEHHEAVRNFVKSLKPPLKLSLPALETLAVIAYKQPVTAPEIMEIRGVQGAGVLKTLLDRKLIAAAGRKNVIGKPILYKTTREFLVQFGLKDLSELPSLKEFEEIRRMAFSDDVPPAGASPAPADAAPGATATVPEALSGPTAPGTDANPAPAAAEGEPAPAPPSDETGADAAVTEAESGPEAPVAEANPDPATTEVEPAPEAPSTEAEADRSRERRQEP